MKILKLCVIVILLSYTYSVKAGGSSKVQQFINHKDWSFVENKGQLTSSEIKYYGHQGGVYLYCQPGKISFVFSKNEKELGQISEATSQLSGNNSPFKRGPGGLYSERETQKGTISQTDLV